ncbi:type IV pilus twitching motility protein PilT [Megamonas funiformis]|uniref:type IV pilus twitching motility protein PilT n=1 Tax=Megamonas funiformis TaxID=437897 RepID=UPI0022783D33|nr:ATPase, T2SS/T4P/T4SS family [Megamonas funiformis]
MEYVFTNKKSLIHQREYHVDFENFSEAIKMAMRQDPDVIMVGEIRDTETMKACLNAAETGHLVLGTLHASSVIEAIIRMESFFNQEQIEAISMQIASSLNSIIIQKLIPTMDGNLVCCMDILLATTAVKNLISKNQLSQLISQMQLNRQNGMQFIQDDIEKLVKAKLIDEKIAKKYIG